VAKLDLRRALRELGLGRTVAGGIELTYEGEPDALRAHGLLFDGDGFSTQVDFNRTFSMPEPQALTYHTPWFATGLADPLLGLPRRTKFDPYLVFHNFGEAQLRGEVSTAYRNESGPQEMQIPLVMQAGETRVLELESYLSRCIPRDAYWAGMEIRYTTKQSALAMTMVSVSDNRKHSIRSVLNWVQATSREGWYWNVAADNDTLVGIQNSGREEASVMFSLDYYVGETRHSYELPLRIPARVSHLVDIGEIKRRGQPDAAGDVIPPEVTFGGYRAVKLTPRGDGTLTTEALIVNRRRATFLSVYNTGCCEAFRSAPPSMQGSVGAFGYIVVELQNQCSGVWSDVTYSASFSSGNNNVATVSAGFVSLVEAGSTEITSSLNYQHPNGGGGGEYESQPCFPLPGIGVCSVTVRPTVTALNIDATNASSTKVTYRTNGTLSSVTFTAPGKTETGSNVAVGDFVFLYDQSNVQVGQSMIKLTSSVFPEVVITVTRTQMKSPAIGVEAEIVLVGAPQDDIGGFVVVPVVHELFERFDALTYSITVVGGSKTLRAVSSSVNIRTERREGVSTEIGLWEERHLYRDAGGDLLNQVMPDVTFATLPPQGDYFRSKFVSNQSFFVASNGLTGIGSFVAIFFRTSEGLVAGLLPQNREVDLVLEPNSAPF
jgi:hypothetical protein